MKKEKRIIAALKHKLVGQFIAKNRMKAFNNALEAARINAEMDLQEEEEKAMNALKQLSNPDVKASEIVEAIHRFVVRRDSIKKALSEMQEVEDFVNEDIEVEEEEEK